MNMSVSSLSWNVDFWEWNIEQQIFKQQFLIVYVLQIKKMAEWEKMSVPYSHSSDWLSEYDNAILKVQERSINHQGDHLKNYMHF